MDVWSSQITISFFFPLLLTLTAGDIIICPDALCRHRDPVIRFPFRLMTQVQKSCGYPGFDLSCDESNQTVLNISNSGLFTVKAVDYATQQIWINDPDDCLPNRLLSLNLSGTAFRQVYPQTFTLFNCSLNIAESRLNPVGCLSGPNYSVFATSSDKDVRFFLSKSCTFMTTVQVPVQWPYHQQVVSSDLKDDIRLTWSEPHCRPCETRRGRCGLQTNSSLEIGCTEQAQNGKFFFFFLTLAAIICLVIMACFVYGKLRYYNHDHDHDHDQNHPLPRRLRYEFNSSVAVAPQPTLELGLDGPTIESFPKVALGESRRLPKRNDSICPICLSEYRPKEIIRTLPDCTHCFHADCVDEWLRLNASCPVCRSSP